MTHAQELAKVITNHGDRSQQVGRAIGLCEAADLMMKIATEYPGTEQLVHHVAQMLIAMAEGGTK